MTKHILRGAAFAFGLSASLPAFAAPTTWTDASGTITTAGTAQTVASLSGKHGFMVCSNYGPMWIDDINTANYVKSIPVPQGQCVTVPIDTDTATYVVPVLTGNLTIISPNQGAGFLARIW